MFTTRRIILHVVVFCLNFMHYQARPSNGQKIVMDENCSGMNYCTKKPKDYPDTAFEGILKHLGLKEEELTKIESRFGGDLDDGFTFNECASTDTYSPIYQIVDKHNDTRYVAQVENIFQQKVKLSTCTKPGRILTAKHLVLDDYTLQNNNLTCTQTLFTYTFLVLSHDGTKVEMAEVKDGLPAFCSCKHYPLI